MPAPALSARAAPQAAGTLLARGATVIETHLPPGQNASRAADLAASLLARGEQISNGLGRGALLHVLVRGQAGNALILPAGEGRHLLTLGGQSMQLGLLFLNASRTLTALAAESSAPAPAATPDRPQFGALVPMLTLKPGDAALIRQISAAMRPYLPVLTARFFDMLYEEAALTDSPAPLRDLHTSWLHSLFTGHEYGPDFVQRQLAFGAAFAQAGFTAPLAAANTAFLRLALPPTLAACLPPSAESSAASAINIALLRLLENCHSLLAAGHARLGSGAARAPAA